MPVEENAAKEHIREALHRVTEFEGRVYYSIQLPESSGKLEYPAAVFVSVGNAGPSSFDNLSPSGGVFQVDIRTDYESGDRLQDEIASKCIAELQVNGLLARYSGPTTPDPDPDKDLKVFRSLWIVTITP